MRFSCFTGNPLLSVTNSNGPERMVFSLRDQISTSSVTDEPGMSSRLLSVNTKMHKQPFLHSMRFN